MPFFFPVYLKIIVIIVNVKEVHYVYGTSLSPLPAV